MAGDGNNSGDATAGKRKLHHLNPRRRKKIKQKVSDQPLTEEEKQRRNEQKKRRVSSRGYVAGLPCMSGPRFLR
jgi:hypothetical protein